MISKECREAIDKATEILEPFSDYKFIKKVLRIMSDTVYVEDWKESRKVYEEKRKSREKELLTAFEEGKTIQYCYARNQGKKPLVWDDLPEKKVRNYIEHGMWEYMKIKDEVDPD